MFYSFPTDFKVVEIEPGWLIRVVWGQSIMLSHLTVQPKSSFPFHNHPSEQMGIVLEGEFEMTIGSETRLLKQGNMYLVPPDTIHGATTNDAHAVILDIFSPPREDYK